MTISITHRACIAALALLVFAAPHAIADNATLDLKLRRLTEANGTWDRQTRSESWKPSETAVVICDMWDYHHCRNATLRVGEMAPRMNELVGAMRDRGVFVIHAPSSCMPFYEKHPARLRAIKASPAANLPDGIKSWCKVIPGEEMEHYPIDQSDGGEDDDLTIHAAWAAHLESIGRKPGHPWKRQIDLIDIDADKDIISDQGDEIWNAMEQRGIRNVLLVGVHTNMCVLGRPFGLRQMAKNGKNVALVRDMTDTMYNPKMAPFVSHYRGTELIIDHIEKYIAPSITSDQIIGGVPLKFKWDVPTKVVVAIAENGYGTAQTLPALAKNIWNADRGYEVKVIQGDPDKHNLRGLPGALKDADALVLSVRRQALPAAQLKAIRDFIARGKPVLALRTTSHGFDALGKGPTGNAEWKGFDVDVLGGGHKKHEGHKLTASFHAADGVSDHEILKGVELPYSAGGGLYMTLPLADSATPLIIGTMAGYDPTPVAWTNTYGDSRIFYTSLGQTEDFAQPAFQRLMRNAMDWLQTLPSDVPTAAGY
jgi:nicotinamidase-related amidase